MGRDLAPWEKIWFCVPPLPPRCGDLPDSIDSYWPWISRQTEIDAWGPFSWTLQSFLRLKAAGLPGELTRHVPDEGIIVAHRDFLPVDLVPSERQYLVCLLADRGDAGFSGRHPWAQFHIVQNGTDRLLTDPDPLWPAAYQPYWPQPGLIPRSGERGDLFQQVAFFGYAHNLAPELQEPSWTARLNELGLEWLFPHRSRWHDYGYVDAVVAVRSFQGTKLYHDKPPSKLHNAWLAGVPAILGAESAYRHVRENSLDYIEVDSIESTYAALRTLRESPELRRRMVEHGRKRANDLQPDRLAKRFWRLLTDIVRPAFERWRESAPAEREQVIRERVLAERRELERRSSMGPVYEPRLPGQGSEAPSSGPSGSTGA